MAIFAIRKEYFVLIGLIGLFLAWSFSVDQQLPVFPAKGSETLYQLKHGDLVYDISVGLEPPSLAVYQDGLVFESAGDFVQTTKKLVRINEVEDGGIYTTDDECYQNLWTLKKTIKGACYHEGSQTIDEVYANDKIVRLTGKAGDSEYSMTMQIDPSFPKQLKFSIKTNSSRTRVKFGLLKEESVYGFGEQGTHVDLRNSTFPLMSSENGIGRGSQPLSFAVNLVSGIVGSGTEFTTYAPSPLFITSENRYLVLENAEYQVWDLSHDLISFDLSRYNGKNDMSLNWYVGRAESILDCLEQVTLHTGRFKMLPDWIYQGAIIGYTGGTKVIKDLVKVLLERKVPLAGVWMQDWTGLRFDSTMGSRLWWNWELDSDHYHDWEDLLDYFKQNHIKAMTYINPYMSDSVETHKQSFKRNIFKEAADNRFLIKDHTENPLILQSASKTFTYGTLDLSNPDAVNFYKEIIRCNMLQVCNCKSEKCEPKVYGWMADFGESISLSKSNMLNPMDDAVSQHNHFPQQWQQLVSEVIADYDEVVPFTRSGWTKTPGLTRLHWVGDQTVSWDKNDGLASALRSTLSCGFSGYTLVHSDVGGYTAISFKGFPLLSRDLELLLRWAEYSAFADTVFRTHIGTNPKQVQVDSTPEASAGFARAAIWHKQLFPYRKFLMGIAASKGWPLTRHMVMEFQDDKITKGLHDQFMMGHCILVAPVLVPGAVTVNVYFPKGEWRHLFSDTVIESTGEWVTVNSPLGQPAGFLRDGSFKDAARSFDCEAILDYFK